jgi:hypothetical protein
MPNWISLKVETGTDVALLAMQLFQGAPVATSTIDQPTKRGSVGPAIVWMFFLEILLFWIPFVGSFVAGFVGGRKAGDVGNAIVAVFLPIVVFSIVLALLATALVAIPIVGAFAGLGGFMFAAMHVGPLLFGAAVGGLTVDKGGL